MTESKPLYGGGPYYCRGGCGALSHEPCRCDAESKPRTPEEISDEWFSVHDGMCVRSIDGQLYKEHFLAALREAAEAGGLEALQRPRESLGKATCGHDSYWRTHYGDCMACQRVTAEARVAELERKLEEERSCHDCREYREKVEAELERLRAEREGCKCGSWDPGCAECR